MARAWWLVLILLAGCTAKPAEPATDGSSDTGLAGVAGVTVNAAIEPIEGAIVLLEPGGTIATSDLFGRFRFEGLAPGSYQLTAQAAGHRETTVALEVAAGETARPRLVLPRAAVAMPTHETVEYQGFLPAGLGPVHGDTASLRQTVFGQCTCTFPITTNPSTVAVIVEAVWTDNLPRPDEPARLRWEAHLDNGTRSGNGSSPLYGVVHETIPSGFFLDILPDAVWPAYEQAFQLFVTRWDVDAPPEGWSRVRGDT